MDVPIGLSTAASINTCDVTVRPLTRWLDRRIEADPRTFSSPTRRRNSTPGLVIHLAINGGGFLGFTMVVAGLVGR